MPVYNKLVRDKISQTIELSGKAFRTRILDEDEYVTELRAKLREETNEFFEANGKQEVLAEMADILEVIRALAIVHGASWEELESVRVRKAEARGAFENRVYLMDVHDA